MSQPKTIIRTTAAPQPTGIASQAVGFANLFFLSGQIALDPNTYELITGDIAAQTHQVLRHIRATLLAAGLDMAHVLKVTVYMKNMSDLARFDAIYADIFDADHPPARTLVEVSRLPKDALIALDLIAAAPAPESDPVAPEPHELATALD